MQAHLARLKFATARRIENGRADPVVKLGASAEREWIRACKDADDGFHPAEGRLDVAGT